MASQRVGDAGLSGGSAPSHHHHHHHNLPYSSVFRGLNPPNTSIFINQESSGFDFGELEEAVLKGVKINNNDEAKPSLYTTKPAATLEMFPSWPTRFQGSSKSGGDQESSDSGSAVNTISNRAEEHHRFDQKHHLQLPLQQQQQQEMMASDHSPRTNLSHAHQPSSKTNHEKRKGAGYSSEKVLDAKTLRRLAQNREAAKKSRLRKKAYVQQLESSRIRLSQLEQVVQGARSQGFLVGGGNAGANISSGGAIFDMEYGRWLDDDHRHMSELRTALQAHLSDADLRLIVDGCAAHYDDIFRIKAVAAKSDIFHLITGMWTTPIERCFLWIGGFRPSELIKMLIGQLDPLTEQQVVGIYSLQQSSQQAEEALSQGLEQLQQSLIDTLASGSVNDGMHHMAVALNKLANLEGFVRQADNLRQQTLHQLCRILTVRQAARCFLAIGEYYSRLRALSSLWASRPRETMIADDNSCQTTTDLHMVQSSHNHFSNF